MRSTRTARARPTSTSLADKVAAGLPAGLVYAGFSMGAAQAQRLAQTRPGAAGALLFESCIPLTGEWAFGPWPDGVPVQVHGMDEDEFFAHEGDLDAARELVATVPDAELFTYPGPEHLFADSSLASYDAAAAALLKERVLAFLGRCLAERVLEPLGDVAHGGAELGATDHAVRRTELRDLGGVPVQVLGAAGQPGAVVSEGLGVPRLRRSQWRTSSYGASITTSTA